jgi:DNA-binding beta-propeller fold protein YncE
MTFLPVSCGDKFYSSKCLFHFRPLHPSNQEGALCDPLLPSTLATLFLAFTPALFAQTFQGFVSTGTHPQEIAVSSFTDKIYTINEPENSVTKIDGATNAATFIPLGVNGQMSLNGKISINPFTNTVYAVDG